MKFLLPILAFASGETFSQAADLVLAAHGTSPVPIVIASDATPRTREAANDLAGYISRITGTKPVTLDGEPKLAPEHAIWIGMQPTVKSLFPAVDFEFKHPEEILIAANANHVVIAGRDRWDPANPDVTTREGVIKNKQQEYGTVNAIYTFIQD